MTECNLVLLRHGQSEWDLSNRFTGWTDVELTDVGREQARRAGQRLAEAGWDFDVGVASVLKRAVRTLRLVLDEIGFRWIPVVRDWRLNERHYGALQGLDRFETARRYGFVQVQRWQHDYRLCPPPLRPGDPRHPQFDGRYGRLREEQLPASESREDTARRVRPCWEQIIAPYLAHGSRVLVVAHEDSLRPIVKLLHGLSDEAAADFEIPVAVPLVYRLDQNLELLDCRFLGEDEAARSAQRGFGSSSSSA